MQQLQGLDTLLLEANHDIHMLETGVYPYPLKRRIMGNRGHLSNERSGQLLCELLHDKFGTVVLGHLSKENNYEELAYEAVRLEVTMGDNPYKADDFPMYVAKKKCGFACNSCRVKKESLYYGKNNGQSNYYSSRKRYRRYYCKGMYLSC